MNVILYRYDIIIHSVRYIVNREDGKKLDPMNLIVAKNIRRLREENKLSMDELSRMSGVSKSMLAQIERGDGNPTISTLWKISNGMKVPFDALTVRPENLYQIVKTSEIQPLLEDNGKVRNYPVFPDDENRRFAVYYLGVGTSFKRGGGIYNRIQGTGGNICGQSAVYCWSGRKHPV